MLANSTRRIDLGYRQLYAFIIRYYCEILRKLNGKDLLVKLRARLNIIRLRQIADLANHLGFESSEITALMQFPKSIDPIIIKGNKKLAIITDSLREIRKDKYRILYT